MKLLSDVQFLKTMVNDGACYLMLMKDIESKNDGIPYGFLSFSNKLLVG